MTTDTIVPLAPRGRASARPRGARRGRHAQAFWLTVFLAPALASIVVLRIAPAVYTAWQSLYTGFPGGIRPSVFVGWQNYQDLFSSGAFLATLIRTIVFNVVINPLQVGLALLIAVLFTRRVGAAGLWRTLVFVPVTIPIVGSSVAWAAALQPDGPINALIALFGGHPQPFFTSPTQALASIVVLASWIGVGYWMLFLIAGLQSIPEDLYEAAQIDRAGPIRTFFSITLPLLKRPLLFVLVADTVSNFVLFAPMQILTNGGPESSTTMLMFDAWQNTYVLGSRNLGSAEIVVLMVIMLFFVALQFALLRDDD